ncbi:DNA recombination protein RmuC [Piscinibacter terrae]|uniref:DNA recombination protein RmuC n=1 Tax=Piscinibacter terrae TaxID=2496871 RepID=A0A3N7JY48_9BURK|nr:DNA recombination protein RmuC [Albitalea terrae]RQP25759.1 DNA recombination protein RmuC [Albitalea terrae]
MNWLTWLILLALVLNLGLLLWMLARVRPTRDEGDATQKLLSISHERLERELRDEVNRSAQGTRVELSNALGMFQQTLLNQQGDVARTQNEQIDSFRTQLAAMQTAVSQALQASAGAQTVQAQASREAQDLALKRFSDAMSEQLRALSEANERRIGEVRTAVEQRLTTLQQGNEQKLEQMRATVDEKLHATLEARLGESFKQVADRLEQVHKGLGEMQTLARDVGSLSRVLNNVKTRGTLGEVQLAGLLEQVLTPEQYERNVETIPGSRTYVDFAIKLPGRRDDGLPVWLPIDCKFPRDDYERLLEAHERADKEGVDQAAKAIETRLRAEARTIREKYIATPHTTDFGILFVPTEGLYAEALRRPGLVEALQREHRITLAGPTTLLATLTSLQMGFRTLALEKRSAEVWEVLGAVKTEFAKFGDVLAKTKKKLDETTKTIEQAEVRTRAMARSLRGVEALPESRAQVLLPGIGADASELAQDDEETA